MRGNNSFKFSTGALILLSLLLWTRCGKLPGKNTSGSEGSNSNPVDSLTSTISSKIITTSCNALKRCYTDIDLSLCNQDVPLIPQMLIELNVSTFISSYQNLIQAEQQFQIFTHTANGQLCINGLAALPCSANEMVAAYNSSQPNNFSNSFYLLRSNGHCPLIYSVSAPAQ